ncbi:fungal-specific transcription factor domain-containing protein [Xylaria venustula]|nr:fungal-specific transcription factor domain-containing protein [Xylaria venustula]
MRPPMRSSIACTKCRKSKIKCENTNGVSPCDSCIKTGNVCVFKVPDPAPPKRLEPPAVVKQERDGGSDRKRLKKIDDISRNDGPRVTAFAEDVLSASFLTENIWEQALDLFKLHFATELSFLHLPTIKEKLTQRPRASHSEDSSDFNLVLLGVLALTARFHPDLVSYTAHICNNQSSNTRTRSLSSPSDPAAASEYYAGVLATALGPVGTMMSTASIDRVAALLMLGLYEWSQIQPKSGGMTAWMYVGNAIRMAQFLGLGFEDAKDAEDAKPGAVDLRLYTAGCQSQLVLRKEIRRRVMFSCFILDRMLACGKHRVSIIRVDDIDIPLPCTEDKFDLTSEVQTSRLTQLERNGNDDSILGRFIQLVDIWGEISRYSCRGGRVEDKHPPWHPDSNFYNLNKTLEKFDLSLPNTFTFSRSNYFKHENHQASSAFVLLHMLRFVCLIMLHREYVPFVPVRCQEPEGPLDQPTFTKEETPAGFWRTSAEDLFKAAKGIVDLIEICQRKDKLPQSTIVLFAIWTTAFVGLYAAHFPQMDIERHMLSTDHEDSREDELRDIFTRGPTALAFQTLQKMSTWQKMASTYVDLLHGMNNYFDTIKQDYYKYSDPNGRPNEARLRVREGGMSGGLEEYGFHPLGMKLKDFGPLRPDEHDVADISERFRVRDINRQPKDTANLIISRSAPPPSFTAINRDPLPITESTRPLSRGISSMIPSQMQPYAESWRHHNTSCYQTHSPPIHSDPPPDSVHQPESTRVPIHEQTIIANKEDFWYWLQREELRRFAATGDLSLFSTGQADVSAMPFSGSFIMSSSPDQFLQQAGDQQI